MFRDRHFHRTGRWHRVSNLPSADTTAPTITVGPSVGSITDTGAVVTWTTDEAATGVVGYGLTAPGSAGAITVVDTLTLTGATEYVTIPTSSVTFTIGDLVLIAMTKRRLYDDFSVVSPTSGWQWLYNSRYGTGNDQTAGVAVKIISGSEPTNWQFQRGAELVSDWSAVVIVLRDTDGVEATATLVEGLDDFTPDAPDITTLTDNAVVLTGHHSSTLYTDYTATATVGVPSGFTLVGKASTTGAWTALARKTEATAGAKVYGSWTNTPDDGASEYQTWTIAVAPAVAVSSDGRAADYDNQSAYAGSYTTAHTATLSGLAADSTYHYVVESSDAAGNYVTSSDDTFATTAGSTGDPGGYPTTQAAKTFVDWTSASLTEPTLTAWTADPNFDASIRRISDSARALYPKKTAWNADDSVLILDRGGPVMLDGQTYESLGSVTWGSYDVWDGEDPELAWRTRSNENVLYRSYPLQGIITPHRTFSGYSFVHATAEGRPSVDGRYHFLAIGAPSSITGALMYDAVADTIRGSMTLPGDVDHVTTSPSGTYGIVRFATFGTAWGQGNWVVSQTCQPIRNINDGNHGDVARDANLNDVFVGWDGSAYASWRLDTGAKTTILAPLMGGHISGVAFRRPGWVYISNHYANFGVAGWDQILACNLDGSGEVQVFCNARTVQTSSQYQYELSTHAVPSTDGKQVTWGGGWERWTTGNSTAHGYVAKVLP